MRPLTGAQFTSALIVAALASSLAIAADGPARPNKIAGAAVQTAPCAIGGVTIMTTAQDCAKLGGRTQAQIEAETAAAAQQQREVEARERQMILP